MHAHPAYSHEGWHLSPQPSFEEFHAMLHTGAFHTVLRSAIEARGLGLTRIRDRLAARGVTLGVSTLSNWQRGVCRPRGQESSRVIAELEDVLGLDPGALGRLLDPGPAAGRWRELGPGSSPRLVKRLRAQLGGSEPGDLTVVSAMDDAEVAADRRVRLSRSRLVVRADRDGVDRHVIVFHTNDGRLPALHSALGCAIGRTAVDSAAGLIAAELVFDPLADGETCPIEYQMSGSAEQTYYGRWIRTADLRFELTVRFSPGAGVSSAHRIWRLDAHTPHKDVGEVRLIGDELVHMIEADPSPGFHGIRWS
jgi:hypothetical protein